MAFSWVHLCTWVYVHIQAIDWGSAMVSCSRSEVIAVGEVGVYHVWSRVVRTAFLCGEDPVTGTNFDHRRQWIHDFLQKLAGLAGVEVGFHAEMANHLHLVLRARPDVVECWSAQDVVRRSMTIERLMKSKTGELSKPLLENEILLESVNKERVAELRTRLVSGHGSQSSFGLVWL